MLHTILHNFEFYTSLIMTEDPTLHLACALSSRTQLTGILFYSIEFYGSPGNVLDR